MPWQPAILKLAARQMSSGLRDTLNREDRPTLERWLRLLPEEMIEQQPGLLMIRVWALQFLWRLDLQGRVLDQVEGLLDSDGSKELPLDDLQMLHGQIFTLRAQQAFFSNQNLRAIDLSRQALALLPRTWTFGRGGTMLFLSLAMQASGQAHEVERLLLEEYEAYDDKTQIYALMLLRSLSFIYLNTGQLEQARQSAQVLLQNSTRSGVAIMKNWSDWFLGVIFYQRNELESAKQHFSKIVENLYTVQITTLRDAVAGLALIHQIKGESTEAWRMVESISQLDLEQRGSEDERTRSLRARLSLLQGDMEGAGRWVDTFSDPPPDRPLLWLEEPQVTRVKVLLARGGGADIELALQIFSSP